MPAHTLPTLPYKTDAFDPLVSTDAIEAHYHGIHRDYVDQLNRVEDAMGAAKHAPKTDAAAWASIFGWQFARAYAGHRLHSLFWRSISPGPRGEMSPGLASQIKADFGSVERLHLLVHSLGHRSGGCGWVVLAYDRARGALRVLGLRGHGDDLPPAGLDLLFALDVWEHAYYLDHRVGRADWVRVFLGDLIDWPAASDRFDQARGTAL